MKNLTVLLITFSILLAQSAIAQDAHFSQFYANPVNLNPTMVGMSGNFRAIVAHRQQGTSTEGYTTSAFSFDSPLATNSGWGVQVIHDSQMNGLLNTTSYYGSLGHRIDINKNSQLGIGLRLGAYQKAFDWSRLTFEDQLDQRDGMVGTTNERFGRNQVSNMDIALGMMYTSNTLFAGATVGHVNRPKENFAVDTENSVPLKYTIHAGGFINLINYRRQAYVLSPNVIYERQGSFQYLHLGMYYGNDVWTVGGWYRVNDAVIASLGINVSKFKIGYSYDFPVADYKSVSGNAHELSIGYQFKYNKKRKIKNTYKGKCPPFQKHLF
ncbi:MAG TPA: type IX secretion system membrane protein PorP/SprF [Fulvivirga sp.]|nr:type IX secretion system membrane protein PorP/SprF [Fulvivirga sp.]